MNGVYYKITGDIIKRAINPWKAQVRSVGSREFSDFSQAEMEEYHDFRNGIGLESALPDESARLWWTEGIDFSTPRSAVLGPYVNTAGTFGAAPVKIIDFLGDDATKKTYAIGNNLISQWSGSAWTTKFPSDAVGWVSPDGASGWTNSNRVFDGDTDLYASFTSVDPPSYTDFIEITLDSAIKCSKVRYFVHTDTHSDFTKVYLDVYYDGAWHNICDEAFSENTWEEVDLAATYTVAKARIKMWDNVANAQTACLAEFDFYSTGGGLASPIDAIVVTDGTDEYLVVSSATETLYTIDGDNWLDLHGCQGYLAFYDTKLRSIDTDGGVVRSSAANNIDGTWDTFNLTGQFGTVYSLFEGKLLADGTPIIYFCGTEGLFTIDITNQKAYKQEVGYPPLTYAGHKGLYWNANVWVATGYGILKIAPSMATFVGPDQDDGLPSGYQGYIYDMVTVNNWLVFCVNGGTTDRSSILKRNSSLGGNLQVYTGGWHSAADTSNTITATDASTQGTLETLLNEIKTDYGTHIASTTYHVAADSTNTIASANASTLATALTLANELKTDYNAHRSQGGVHLGNDPDNVVVATTATDLATAITLANEIKTDYNLHILSVGGAIACLHHSPSSLYTNGRLWFGEGTNVKYIMFPDTTSNVKQISTYQYVNDSGYGKLPIFRNLAVIPKVALGIGAITKDCTETGTHDETIEVYYGLNGADPTTHLGDFTTSPKPTILTFGSGLGIEFYTMQFATKLTRGTTKTDSPELESLLFNWYPAPVRISAWVFDIRAIGENADRIFTEFEAIRDTNTLVAFYPSGDPNKTSYNVKLTQMPSREWWEEQGAREGYFQVVCEEIFKG